MFPTCAAHVLVQCAFCPFQVLTPGGYVCMCRYVRTCVFCVCVFVCVWEGLAYARGIGAFITPKAYAQTDCCVACICIPAVTHDYLMIHTSIRTYIYIYIY